MTVIKAIFLFLILGVLTAPAQSLATAWKGIVPPKTNRDQVEAKLGKGEVDSNGYARYKTDEAFIEVNYSSEPCRPDANFPNMKRNEYKVSAATVLSYSVVPRSKIRFDSLGLDLSKYYRDDSGDVRVIASYLEYIEGSRKVSSHNGTSFSVEIQAGVEYVRRIRYFPRRKDADKLLCEAKTKSN